MSKSEYSGILFAVYFSNSLSSTVNSITALGFAVAGLYHAYKEYKRQYK